jgi:hypothetical protein
MKISLFKTFKPGDKLLLTFDDNEEKIVNVTLIYEKSTYNSYTTYKYNGLNNNFFESITYQYNGYMKFCYYSNFIGTVYNKKNIVNIEHFDEYSYYLK